MTRAASWSTAPDGSVRSSECADVIETLEDRSLLSAGDLDSTFGGGDGIATTDFNVERDWGFATVVQSDGKIIAVGQTLVGSFYDTAVVRYNADGTLDSSFGSGGKTSFDFNGSDDSAFAVALQADGKIVVAGSCYSGPTNTAGTLNFAVARLNSNGTLDNSFDGDGKLMTDFAGADDGANGVVIQSDGKIVVAGSALNGANRNFATVRYNTDGTLDTNFGSGGKVTTDFGLNDVATSLVLQSDGKIVLAGATNQFVGTDFALVRYTTTGALDSTFDGDGKQTTAFFGFDEAANSVTVQPDGKIVAAGYTYDGTNAVFALARYGTNGLLDSSFDTDGLVTTSIGANNAAATGVKIQASGQIVAVGYASASGSNTEVAIARYNANGSLDTNFGTNGKVETDISPTTDNVGGLALLPDGNILVVGTTTVGPTDYDIYVAKYLNGPSLSISDASITEGNNSTTILSFTVTLSEAASSGFSVAYSTQNGTATTANNDYVAISNGSLSFTGTAGETQTISVTVNGDTNIELNETLSVILGTITGNSQVGIADGTGVGTILNDDVAPTLSIGDAAVTEGNVFTRTLLSDDFNNENNGYLTGNYAGFANWNVSGGGVGLFGTSPNNYLNDLYPGHGFYVNLGSSGGGRLESKNDFTLEPGRYLLTFNLGNNVLTGGNTNTATVSLGSVFSKAYSRTGGVSLETISEVITVNSPTSAKLAFDETADPDSSGLIIDDVALMELQSQSVMTFNVTLSGNTSTPFTVGYSTQDGTATAFNNDYVPASNVPLRIGSFDNGRGGADSLVDGPYGSTMKSLIQTNFPTATFSSTYTLTDAFLSNIDVLWLNAIKDDSNPVTPLSGAEQAALLNFVNSGKSVLVFGDNYNFNDGSFLGPFGAETTFVEFGSTATVTNHTDPITNGPFGAVNNISGYYGGHLTTLGPAVPLATWTTGGQTAVAVDQRGALSPTSGLVVLFADSNFYNYTSVSLADNTKLLLNALAAAKPVNTLTFAGTAGETQTISVVVNGDILFEPDETLNVVLGTITGNNQVTIADGTGQGTIINDDVYSAGDLDLTFGNNGTATYSNGTSSINVYDSALQSDGKIVVVGYVGSSSFVVRFNVDGTLDTSFGTGGVGAPAAVYGRSVAIQSDGKIVVCGGASTGNLTVVRYNTDGTLDMSFGVNGVASQQVGPYGGSAGKVVIQSDGKIVVGGSGVYYIQGFPTLFGLELARFNTNGTPDTTFGSGGGVFYQYGWDTYFSSMALDANGKIVVAGSYDNYTGNGYAGDYLILRFNTNGTLETTLSTGLTKMSVYDVVVQPDGKLVFPGGLVIGSGAYARSEYGLFRMNPNGGLDTSFGVNGFARGNGSYASYIALQPNGQIVTLGGAKVTRYNPDGSLDTNFKIDGTASVVIGNYSTSFNGLAIAPDSSIVLAGSAYDYANSRYDVGVARLNGGPSVAGLQPTTFPGGGTVTATGPHTLTTGTGDGSVTVGVDGYGSFGSQVAPNGTDATYDPIGPIGASVTTFGSTLAFRVGNSGSREFLSSDTIFPYPSGGLARPTITGTTTDAISSFSRGGLNFSLAQSVDSLFDNNGALTGSLLTQTYTITNPTGAPIDFELIRYLEGDLSFGNGFPDGGGRFVTAAGDELLYQTDQGGTSSTSTTFVGISGIGGTAPTANRYELGVFSDFGSRILAGNALGDVIAGDNNADGFVDAANTADVGVALRNTFSLLAGATTTYSTHTLFGNGVPNNIGNNPNQPAPAPATSVSVAIGTTTSVAENNGSQQLTYTLTRVGDTSGALTVNVTFGGAASLGSDYSQSGATIVSGNNATVTFMAGSATAEVTVTGLDDLTDENTEAVTLTVASGSGYAVGSPANASGDITDNDDPTSASFTIPSDGSVRVVRNGNNVEIRSVPGDVLLTSRDVTTLGGGLTIVGGTGPDDTLIVDESQGSPIPAGGLNFDAGTGNDRLVVIGDGTQNPNYSPDGTTNGTGDVTQATGTIHFTGVENSDFDTVGTFTLTTPNGDDTVNLANGLLGSGQDATSISGNSGGVGFPTANVRNSGIVIDTTSVAGTDTVTVTSASNNHGNTSLNVIAGTEAGDIININGTTTFSGTTTLDAKTINLNANVTNAVTGTTATLVNVTAPGQIQDGIDAVAGGGTVHIAAGSYSGNVDTSAKSVSLDPAGAVSSTGNWTLDNNDTLNVAINGTTAGTQYDQINVTGGIALGGAILNVTGSYTPTTADTFEIIKATGTVTGSLDASTYLLNGKPLTPAITSTAPGKVVLGFDATPDLSGTGGNDDFVISRDNNGNVVVKRNGVTVFTVPEGDLTSLNITPGDGDDTLVVDVSNGDPIPAGGLNFNGGVGNDRLVIIGDGTQAPNYSPDGTDNGDGSVTLTEGTINFSDTENADFDNVGTFTLTTPNADDVVNMANALNGDGQDATSISGTSGGVGFTPANVRNSGIVIDTTSVAGTDTVSIFSADNAHGNTTLTVTEGTEAGDELNILGTTTFSGLTTLDAKTINLDADITNAVTGSTATTVNVSAPGQIQDGIDVAAANGGTVNIAMGTYTGDVNTSGKSVTLDLEPSVADVHSTGNWTLDANDALNFVINGTTPVTQYEQLVITGNITLGGARLNLFGTHVPAPADTFEIIKATGTVSGSLSPTTFPLNSKPLEATYTAGPPGNVTLGFDSTPSIEGGAGADDFEVSLDNAGNIIVKRNGVEVLKTPLAGLTELTIDATDADDSLLLDLRNGNPIPTGGLTFNGGAGDDEAYIRGTNGEIVQYTPDATTNGSGQIDIDGKIVNFTGLEPVDFDSVLSFTLNLPNGDDVVSITNGFNSAVTALLELAGTVPAIVFSGTSGGIGFEAAHVFRTTNVTVDTTLNTDGADTITIVSADNAHLNTNLSIITGSGGDAVNFVGAINVPGTVTISTDGVVTDDLTDSVTDITAATLSITAGSIGASGNDLDTSVNSLTTDTSASGGDQFLHESTGLTDLNLNAGSGDITLVDEGQINDTAADGTDIAADSFSLTITTAGEFGAGNNRIETDVTSLSATTLGQDRNVYIAEANSLTNTNITIFPADIHLSAGGDINTGTGILTGNAANLVAGGSINVDTTVSQLNFTTTANGDITVNETDNLGQLNIDAGTGDVTITAGGTITDGDGALDVTANGLSLTATSVGASGNAISTSVDTLTIDTSAANGDQFVTEANGLTGLDLDAGTGDVILNASGAITDGDGATDIVANDVTLTATGVGATGNAISTSADTLTVDTSASNGDQFFTEANGLTDLHLNAGTGDVSLTLTLGGIADTASDGTDITATDASITLSDVTAQTIGASGNPIELAVTTLATSTAAGNGDQFLAEADSVTVADADMASGTGTMHLVTGTYFLSPTGSMLGNVIVESGVTLGGTGTVTGTVFVSSTGTVTPGVAGTGILNTGSVTFTPLSNFVVEVNGNVAGTGYDQLNVTGTVNLGGATLNATGTIPSLTGQTIVLINNDDVDPVIGTFAGLAEGDTVFINGIGFKLSYHGGTGNDVTLTQLIQVSVTVTPLGVAEDGTQRLTYTFHRNGILDVMTVNFGISGTALVGEDFTEPSSRVLAGSSTGTFRFGYGDSDYVITVIPIADPFVELDETLILTVLPGATYVPSVPDVATGTIVNDDSVQEVSVTVSPASTTEDGSGNLVYTFTRTGGSALQKSKSLTVDFAVGGGANDATFGTDYTVSGARTFGASSGTVTFGAKNSTAVITVDPTPDKVVEPNETVVLTLAASPNYNVVSPDSASGVILDDDTVPTVTLSIDNANIAEASGVATVTATLSSVRSQPVTVTLGLTGTATGGGTDYTASGTTIVIPAGSTTGSITLTAVQDPTDEPDETIIVDITGVTNATESGIQQVTTSITDDDDPAPTVTLSVDNANIAEAAGIATVTATLSAPSSSDVTVNLVYTGTASGTDYIASGASILITAGNTIGTVTITAVSDALNELDETVLVDISSVINGTELGTQQVTTTIIDDDPTPTVTLGINSANIPETGGTATVTATLSAPSGQDVTVNLAFTGGALNGTDYSATGASILIAAGNTTGSITLSSISDTDNEGNETIVVDIDGVTNAIESGAQQVTTTIVDDDFGTTLVVTLGNSNNDVVVSQSGGNLYVKRGTTNLITPTPIASVSSLHIEGGSAVDKVTLQASLLGQFVGQFSFSGNNGNDVLNAQAIVGAGSFATLFNGGAGNDIANGGAGNDTFLGGAGIDNLKGNAGNDSLDGGDDKDSLSGGDGNDTIHGGASGTATQYDLLDGGNGDDLLYGDDGRDSLLGGAGNDTLLGGLGNDTIDGGTGDDGICGNEGDDSLKGGAGNDTILGEAGNDKLYGDAGADLLIGGDGNDTLTGGSDTDADSLDGGAGTDSVTLKVNDIEAAFTFDCDDFFI